ncbi:hypothetical protein K0M31_013929, partial [Melipona bicolor]
MEEVDTVNLIILTCAFFASEKSRERKLCTRKGGSTPPWTCYSFLFRTSSFKCKGDSRALTDAKRLGSGSGAVGAPLVRGAGKPP